MRSIAIIFAVWLACILIGSAITFLVYKALNGGSCYSGFTEGTLEIYKDKEVVTLTKYKN